MFCNLIRSVSFLPVLYEENRFTKFITDPKTQQGHFLLHRTTFALGGHVATSMTLIPRTTTSPSLLSDLGASTSPSPNPDDPPQQEHQVLLTSPTGSIALLTPLSEPQYRHLNTLTTHLTNTLYHPCGLNPRAYRVDRDAPVTEGGRTVVDGNVLGRWLELGSQRRAEIAGRVGVDGVSVREELVGLRGGLGFL